MKETRNVLGLNSFQQRTARLWRSRANPFTIMKAGEG
jgi:hypothetical protein